MSQHTKGRLTAEQDRVYTVEDSIRVATTCGDTDAQANANAARIVACVNNCEGIDPEAVPEMVERIEALEKVSASNETWMKAAVIEEDRLRAKVAAADAVAASLDGMLQWMDRYQPEAAENLPQTRDALTAYRGAK